MYIYICMYIYIYIYIYIYMDVFEGFVTFYTYVPKLFKIE